jgi:hypothetical protein
LLNRLLQVVQHCGTITNTQDEVYMIRISFEFATAQDALIEITSFAAGLAGGSHAPDAGKAGSLKAVVAQQFAPNAALLAQTEPAPLYAPAASLGPENQTEGAQVVEPPKRGRPRKNQTPSAGPSADAQPAVASNTGSSAAVSSPPAAEQASTSDGPEKQPLPASSDNSGPGNSVGAAPSISYTAEQVRAKLQEFLQKPGGDAGLVLASKVLAQFGLTKVKQINDHPEHYAAIVAAVDAELKVLG